MPKKTPAKRGPKAETLKLRGPLDAALKKFMATKRPATGWPKRGRAAKAPEPEAELVGACEEE